MSRASGHQSRFLRPRAPCATGHFPAPAAVWPLVAGAVAASFISFSICLSFLSSSNHLTGSAPWRAVGAEPPKNQLAFAKHALAERGRGRRGNLVPVHIFDIAAAVTDEVVMRHALGIKSRCAALHGHFTH